MTMDKRGGLLQWVLGGMVALTLLWGVLPAVAQGVIGDPPAGQAATSGTLQWVLELLMGGTSQTILAICLAGMTVYAVKLQRQNRQDWQARLSDEKDRGGRMTDILLENTKATTARTISELELKQSIYTLAEVVRDRLPK